MSTFIIDHDQYEVINHAHSISWELFIDYWQSKSHYQHQKFADNGYQTVNRLVNTFIYCEDAPSYMWILVSYIFAYS